MLRVIFVVLILAPIKYFLKKSFTVFHYPSDIASPLDIETAYGEHNDTFIIDIKRGIDKNDKNITLQIQLNFTSKLTDTLQGFYRSSYKDGANQETK